MCGSAQKGGINADTIARSVKRCLINKAVRKKGFIGRSIEEAPGTIVNPVCPVGVFIYPRNLNRKTQHLRNSHIEDDTCGWLTACFLAGLRSDFFIVSILSDCF